MPSSPHSLIPSTCTGSAVGPFGFQAALSLSTVASPSLCPCPSPQPASVAMSGEELKRGLNERAAEVSLGKMNERIERKEIARETTEKTEGTKVKGKEMQVKRGRKQPHAGHNTLSPSCS